MQASFLPFLPPSLPPSLPPYLGFIGNIAPQQVGDSLAVDRHHHVQGAWGGREGGRKRGRGEGKDRPCGSSQQEKRQPDTWRWREGGREGGREGKEGGRTIGDVHMWEVGEEVVPHKHTDEDEVVNDPLEVKAGPEGGMEFERFEL